MNLKMSERDKKLLLLFGIVALLCLPMIFVQRPLGEKTELLETEMEKLQDHLASLEGLMADQETFIETMEVEEMAGWELTDKFPAELSQEKSILFLYETEQILPVLLPAISFQEEMPLVIGASQGTETETTAPAAAPLNGVKREMDVTFSGNYDDFKELMKYVMEYPDRMVMTGMSINARNELDTLEGIFTLAEYALCGEEGRPVEVIEPELRRGTDNVFRQAAGTAGGGEETEGETSDFFLMLSQPDADEEAKVFGRTSDGVRETYLTADGNSKQEAGITFTGADGEYRAFYRIGKESFGEEGVSFTKSDAIGFEIISSARVGGDDEVSVKLEIVNETDRTVHVSVIGDDKENPRVEIAKKTGSILMKQ